MARPLTLEKEQDRLGRGIRLRHRGQTRPAAAPALWSGSPLPTRCPRHGCAIRQRRSARSAIRPGGRITQSLFSPEPTVPCALPSVVDGGVDRGDGGGGGGGSSERRRGVSARPVHPLGAGAQVDVHRA